ncbi:MAG: HDOD domain-containing protein [Pseudomonadales bacterium]|nr:HDOD domain-containing protein [Pseudomonadales bacterium]
MSSTTQQQDLDVCLEVETYITMQLKSGKLELPVLPTIATEVLSTSMEDDADALKVSNLIQQDQSIAANVLRIVNSPAYRGAAEIVALQQAIARLGLNRIREIAITIALSSTQSTNKEYQDVAEREWNVALATGLWTKEIARVCRKNVEIAYLCGLLHNIGVPLVLKLARDATPQILSETQLKMVMAGKMTALSLVLAQSWQIPMPIQVAIEQWRQADYAGEHAALALITGAGVKLANWMLNSELEISNLGACAELQALDIYPEDAEQLLELADKVRATMESIG